MFRGELCLAKPSHFILSDNEILGTDWEVLGAVFLPDREGVVPLPHTHSPRKTAGATTTDSQKNKATTPNSTVLPRFLVFSQLLPPVKHSNPDGN